MNPEISTEAVEAVDLFTEDELLSFELDICLILSYSLHQNQIPFGITVLTDKNT